MREAAEGALAARPEATRAIQHHAPSQPPLLPLPPAAPEEVVGARALLEEVGGAAAARRRKKTDRRGRAHDAQPRRDSSRVQQRPQNGEEARRARVRYMCCRFEVRRDDFVTIAGELELVPASPPQSFKSHRVSAPPDLHFFTQVRVGRRWDRKHATSAHL